MSEEKSTRSYLNIHDIIISITSIITVLLVFFTLKEMQRERENSYAPCFVLESKYNQAIWGEWDSEEYKRLLNYLEKDEDSVRLIDSEIVFHNIGIGAAKNIIVTCDMSFLEDYVAFINPRSNVVKWYVEKYHEDTDKPEYFVYNNVVTGGWLPEGADPKTLYLTTDNSGCLVFHTGTQNTVTIPYAHANDEDAVSINLEPCLYAEYIITTNAEYTKDTWVNLPPFEIELKYEDIHGNEYLQRFEVCVEALQQYYPFGEDEDKGFVQYRLLFNEL